MRPIAGLMLLAVLGCSDSAPKPPSSQKDQRTPEKTQPAERPVPQPEEKLPPRRPVREEEEEDPVKPAAAGEWEPEAKFLAQLGPAKEIDGYQVLPPDRYAFAPMPSPQGSKGFFWKGKARTDLTSPILMVVFLMPPAEEAKKITLEQFLTQMLEGVKRRRVLWQQTEIERGKVNGMTFLRVRWSGMDTEMPRKMHGFMYAAQDGDRFMQISSQDVEPHHEEALKLAEAAVLTFKKK